MSTIMQPDAENATTASVEATVAAIVDSGPALRATWQTGPCPAWCDNAHRDDDYTADRVHAVQLAPVALSLYDDDRPGKGSRPGQLRIDVEQHYRQSEPDVTLVMPEHKLSDSRVTGETDLMLTLAEARAVRDRLSAVLARIDAASLDLELVPQEDRVARNSADQVIGFGAPFDSGDHVRAHLTQWAEPDCAPEVEVTVAADITVACATPNEARGAAAQLRLAADRIDALAEAAESANARIGAGQ